MKKVVGKIKMSNRKHYGGLVSLYWNTRTADGQTRRDGSFYWGALPTKPLEKLLALVENPGRNERKRICRMLGITKLPKEKLQDSDFLKSEVLDRLKIKQRQPRQSEFDFTPTPLQREQFAKICADIHQMEKRWRKNQKIILNGMIQLQRAGLAFIGLTNSLPGKRMTIDFWQQYKDKFIDSNGRPISLELCKLSASVAKLAPLSASNPPPMDLVLKSIKLLVKEGALTEAMPGFH